MGGGKGKIAVVSPPPAPVPTAAPPVRERQTANKAELYSAAAKSQSKQDGRRATILTGGMGDESEARVRKNTLLGS